MHIDQYTYEAMKTRLPTANKEYALLGLAGEVGELYSLVAKSIRDQKQIDLKLLKAEVADCVWFLSAISVDYGFSLSEALEENLAKLQKRKKAGTLTGSGDNR
jgi:NTP pyrophosphatase (non-canonical NTP hydrolase)